MLEIDNQLLQGYTFIDLFAGLGGFRLALESLGARCVFASENNAAVARVYARNFGDTPAGDITQIDPQSIPNHDILCGGFPCQAFSISGKQRGFADTRGTLFFNVASIVQAKRPKILFLENVKNIVTHDSGNTMQVIKATLCELGYTLFYKVLSASHYGVPQKRERVYMVAFRKDLGVDKFDFPPTIDTQTCVQDILLDADQHDLSQLRVYRKDMVLDKPEPEQGSSKPIRLGRVGKGGQGERIYSVRGAAITLSAFGGGAFAKTGGYLVDGEARRLHPRECARLMGFPDNYELSENANQAYRQLGNSVVVNVVQHIMVAVVSSLHQV
jgi:DNA (cytosine-5)-methyltransferase 1